MPTISYVSIEEHETLKAELRELRKLVTDLLNSLDDRVNTTTALKLTGLKSRTTLIAERKRTGTLLSCTKNGRSVSYSRLSCIEYRHALQLDTLAQPR